MNLFQKYVTSILLLVLLFFIFGHQFYFKFLQYKIQHEIEEATENGVNEKDLTLIIVSPKNESEIHWIKKEKEFRYKGSMYDVVKIKTEDNKKFYYCINDIKELDLITGNTRNNKEKHICPKR